MKRRGSLRYARKPITIRIRRSRVAKRGYRTDSAPLYPVNRPKVIRSTSSAGPRKTQRLKRVPAVVVYAKPYTTKPQISSFRKRSLRLGVQPTVCMRRKAYKKTMLRKLAAQIHASGGNASLKRWRKVRRNSVPMVKHAC